MKEQNKKVFHNHRCCQLCLRSEPKWCHMYVYSPFQLETGLIGPASGSRYMA